MRYFALLIDEMKIIRKILRLDTINKYICRITIQKPNNYEKIITDFIIVFF